MKKNNIIVCGLLLATTALSGCVPVALGGVGATAGAFVSEKGLSGTLSDARLTRAVREKYEEHSTRLYEMVIVSCYGGEIMLLGTVPNETMRAQANELAWQVTGVKKVIDEIQVTDKEAYKNEGNDKVIVTTIKSKLMFASDIHSLNFEVYSINNTVYLTGIAYDDKEAQRVMNIASGTSNVKLVKSYINLKNRAPNASFGKYPSAVQQPTAKPVSKSKQAASDDMPKPADVVHG